MATFEARFHVLESIIRQVGQEVVVCEVQGGKEAKIKPSEIVQAVNDDKVQLQVPQKRKNSNLEVLKTENPSAILLIRRIKRHR